MYVIKNQLNAHQFETVGEKNTMPSMTVPDQSMSIQEILRRFASGLPVGGAKVAFYDDGENPMPDPRKMDLAEWQETRENYIAELKELKAKHRRKPPVQAEIPLPTTTQPVTVQDAEAKPRVPPIS